VSISYAADFIQAVGLEKINNKMSVIKYAPFTFSFPQILFLCTNVVKLAEASASV